MADQVYNTPTVVNPNIPPVTANTVYSPENVAQTLTNPATKPDLSDPFGTYNYYMNSPEIQAVKAESQRVAEAINASRQGLRTTTTALQNQNEQAQGGTGASINLIGRQVGKARELTSNELAALSENQMATQAYLDTLIQDATAKYNIAETQRAQVQDLIRQTGGKAGISYADTYESAVKKADDYMVKKEKEAKKEAYKDSLKQQLLALGKNTKGLSTKELEKKLKKYNKNSLAEAKAQAAAEWKMKVAQFNKSMSANPGASAELSAVAKVYSETGGNWSETASKLANLGYDVSPGSVIDNELRRRNGLDPINNSSKPATQAQQLASGFATRLDSAGKILNNYSDLGASMIGTVSGAGWFPNVLKSSDRQQMEQAQRDFINAQLRRESGAVISDSEFENAAKQYFAQPGDSESVLAQKKRARDIAIQNMQNAAGSAYSGSTFGEQDINDILKQFGI